jgi:Ca2+:H+ antiporter
VLCSIFVFLSADPHRPLACLSGPVVCSPGMAGAANTNILRAWWVWVTPVLALLLFAAGKTMGFAGTGAFLIVAAVLLIGSVFSAVFCAELVAARIGQPFGAVILALAIIAIEVGLIVSMMLSGSESAHTVARDTVLATVMIVLNGIVGLCLVAGGIRHFEQDFREEGAAALLSVTATLAVIALVLPNFTIATLGPSYSREQLMFVGIVSIALYGIFVFVQTVRHRDHFVSDADASHHGAVPGGRVTLIAAGVLVVGLLAVILLAKSLSPFVEQVVENAGLPREFVGVIIATIVLLPEGLAAFRAATRNQLQISLNASLGSALASIGLTIPVVAILAVYLNLEIHLGVSEEQMVLLVLSLFISALSFGTGRTTVLQGCVHLVIFGVYIFLSAIP